MAPESLQTEIVTLKQQLFDLQYAERLHHALFKIASLSHEELALTDLYQRVHEIVSQFIDAKNFFIGLLNEEEQTLTLPYFVDEQDVGDKDMTGQVLQLGQGLSSYVIRTKKPKLLTPDKITQLMTEGEIKEVLGSTDFKCWMGAPMITGGMLHGIIVVQSYAEQVKYNQQDLQFLDYVANHIAMAIESNINATQRREAQRHLAEQHRLLEQNNKMLTDTIAQLKKTQQELVQREKMASLGGLVAGIAHEINTPLGICVTGISHLAEEHKQLKADYVNGTLTEEALQEYLDEIEQGLKIISTNADRGAELVKSFKQVAVDQSSNEQRQINVRSYLDEILLSLKPKLKRLKHTIEIECEPQLSVMLNAGAISQVFSNLIMNSIIHGFDEIEQGRIKISIYSKNNNLVIHYADNGKGLAPESLNQLFEPFYTTKRGDGGSGLGTHLIYNLVHSSLKGSIKVNSELGKGLAYLIKIPLTH
ncbi:hypothetical protein tinsulaeT_28800 [Thalassotalea insulae]|uniref:histidine kinase n=1 Tax=Thalassotalea insulae TaxID=2056778 RepID=A0ABQ6GYF2_9GAMM|nr:ATP-binding protein [Thalassotalea insulae]GLX79540.1 hypothetical protein tinsulaeT_28800 [Thalassotalea insulae]